jgi:hypothetical protein
VRTSLLSALAVAAASLTLAGAPQSAPSLEQAVQRMGQYVAAYGAQASLFVGTERYTQRIETDLTRGPAPVRLVSEYAIVRTDTGDDWTGFRDVVEVDGQPVVTRRDRLVRLLTGTTIDGALLKQIANESSRYNVGPVIRNLNVPTMALFLLQPSMTPRFSFKRKGTKEIEGVQTWELEFKESRRPTVIRTLEGKDVPAAGRVWVVPTDGTVVRTLLHLEHFADAEKDAPSGGYRVDTTTPPTATRSQVGGEQGVPRGSGMAGPTSNTPTPRRWESLATVEVTYRLDKSTGVWLPLKMSETYEGALPIPGGRTLLGRASGVAEYSDFKQFQTSARIVTPK